MKLPRRKFLQRVLPRSRPYRASQGRKLLAVAHTFDITGPLNVRIRIVSARKATKRERRSYENEPQ
jgi:uncharacterized DUF497 family protein